eukprot:TRINITY_DN757_c0_g1_i1.p1 TRINITY_DN757_c0_g1~~TRINITY_DN757_c0_g1_i1.p1  ORF type:complete len:463 (-),score=81.12 TRINITY_DN757_c0_g1_i1:110-1498(-)
MNKCKRRAKYEETDPVGSQQKKKSKPKKKASAPFALADDSYHVHKIAWKENFFRMSLNATFSNLYKNELHSDIKIKIGDSLVPAHRTVLFLWSSVFEKLLEGKQQGETIVIEEDPEVFSMMIEYIYLGELIVKDKQVVPLLKMAHAYNIVPLKEECANVLGDHVSESNVFDFIDNFKEYECEALERRCGNFLAKNFKDLLDGDRIMSCGVGTWIGIIKSDDVKIDTETQVFEAVMKYCNQFKGEKRDESLNKLLPLIRWVHMTPRYLIEHVEGDKTIQHLPIIKELLNQTFKTKLYPKYQSNLITTYRTFSCVFLKVGSKVTLSKNNTQAKFTGYGWQGSALCSPVNCYFVKLVSGCGNLMLGMGPKGINIEGNNYQTKGYYFYCLNGSLYSGHGQSGKLYYQKVTPDSIIGCFWNTEKKTISFMHNGADLGVAYTGVDGDLQPVFDFYENSVIQLVPYKKE